MKNITIFIFILGAGILLFTLLNNFSSPTNNTETVSDKQFASGIDKKSGITFNYPLDFDYKYVSASEWPPHFVSSHEPNPCKLSEETAITPDATSSSQTYNGINYCVRSTSEGAAGSIYTTYRVTYQKDGQFFTMSYILQFPHCENYPREQVTECQTEQNEFPINAMIDRIAQSAYLPN